MLLAQIKAGDASATLSDVRTALEFAVGDWASQTVDVNVLLQLGQAYLGLVRARVCVLCVCVFRAHAHVCKRVH